MKYQYISVEGNIGSGKTSLAKLLAEHFNAKLVLEEFAENPFLPLFYENSEKYAFQLELSFLAERFYQLKNAVVNRDIFSQLFVSDYGIFKCPVFASVNLNEMEKKLYQSLFTIMETHLPQPDLVVYLYLSVGKLQQNIANRGRNYEKQIQDTYLQSIQESYLNYFKQHPEMKVLVVESHNLDFVKSRNDFMKILSIFEKDYPKGLNFISF
jgi:deoxyguanosine kinase